MHFIALTHKEWEPNSLRRYCINSSVSKTCFVTAIDVRSYVKDNYPKSLPFALKSTLAFEIHWVMFPLLRCLLMPSASLLLAPLNLKSAFSLQRIFRCQIFPCEDWQFGVLVFAVLFAWEMVWDSPIVNIVLQTMKRQLFMNTLVIGGNSKSLSVECCLETKMRRDVKLLSIKPFFF